MIQSNITKISHTLLQIKSRAESSLGHRVTHQHLAEMAGVSKRSVDEWMRGAVNPSGVAVFELLSKLNSDDVVKVVEFWKSNSESGQG